MYVSCRADELIRFWGHEVKGQRSQGSLGMQKQLVIALSERTDWWIPAKLWSCMYLAEPMNWLDFGVTRLKVKGHRAHYVCKNSSWSRYFKNRLMDCCQTYVMYVTCRANELIRFWGHEVKGQRPQRTLCMQKQLVIALSQEPIDGFPPNLGHVCYLKSRWTD